MSPVAELIGTAVAGLGVGFLSGVFGLGGGFLIVPVLHILLGIDVRCAVGAAACQVLGPATTSLLARRPQKEHFRLPLILAGGQTVGTLLGAKLLEGVGGAELLVLGLYFSILLSIGLFALWESRRSRGRNAPRRGWLSRWKIPPNCRPIEMDGERISVPLLAWFGVAIGFFAGLLGISGGLLLLPGLVYLWGMRTHDAIRASLVMVWIGAIPNTVAHALLGHIDLRLVMALLVGGTFGARLGSEVAARLAGPQLRQRFGWLLLGTAGFIGYRLVQLLSL